MQVRATSLASPGNRTCYWLLEAADCAKDTRSKSILRHLTESASEFQFVDSNLKFGTEEICIGILKVVTELCSHLIHFLSFVVENQNIDSHTIREETSSLPLHEIFP